jgi:PAS domain S-box-containing protein
LTFIGTVLAFLGKTKSKQSEVKRRLLSERINLLLESTDQGIYGIDFEGKCIFVNKAAMEMLGYERNEIIGRDMHSLVHHHYANGTTYDEELCPAFQTFKKGQGIRVDNELLWRKDGSSFPVEFSSHPIFEDGKLNGAVATFTDITKRKESEHLLEALSEIMKNINSTLDSDEIVKRVMIKTARAIGADAAEIILRENGGWKTGYTYSFGQEPASVLTADERARVAELMMQTKKPISGTDLLNDSLFNKRITKETGIKPVLAIPLIVKGELIGILELSRPSSNIAFTEAQIDFADKLASSVSVALENARFYENEHRIAETLQSVIISAPKAMAGIDVGYLYKSAAEVAKIGGDFFDFYDQGYDKIGFVIGDVSGKGLEAAAITYMVKSVLKAFAYQNSDPEIVLTETNNFLCGQFKDSLFVTAIYGTIDISNGRIRMASAGHPDPFICTSNECNIELAKRNLPLGIKPDSSFDSFEIVLDVGDKLVLYTDGLIEARNAGELFGEERVRDTLQSAIGIEPDGMVTRLITAAEGFSHNKLSDDVALVVIEYRGNGNGTNVYEK